MCYIRSPNNCYFTFLADIFLTRIPLSANFWLFLYIKLPFCWSQLKIGVGSPQDSQCLWLLVEQAFLTPRDYSNIHNNTLHGSDRALELSPHPDSFPKNGRRLTPPSPKTSLLPPNRIILFLAGIGNIHSNARIWYRGNWKLIADPVSVK